ncbi:MAG: PadR family transcriptional regulator [Candidatus Microbacterium colombiense]|nr:MAG: PadR family transcriptional regulator [Microbacterium sp.]
MAKLTRVTAPTLDVVQVLLGSAEPVWGLALAKAVERAPGTVYPILSRLEDLGWLVGEWEGDSDHTGPRRRYYRLTDEGRAEAAAVIAARQRRVVTVPSPRLAFGGSA